MTDHLLRDVSDGVATLTFNRPEARNALSLEMRAALCEAMLDIEQDAAVRVVVVRGAGEHFMGGGDVKRFHAALDDDDATRRQGFIDGIGEVHRAIVALRRMPKPVIASVRGAAAGFGMSLVTACDLAIAADDAFFIMAYCHLGVSPDGSGTFHLPRITGMKRAMEIALLGERIGAETARELGLVNWVVPAAALEAETGKLAARLASGPTRAYGKTKRLLGQSLGETLENQLEAEAESFAECIVTDDFKEGVRAFVDKRRPSFSGN